MEEEDMPTDDELMEVTSSFPTSDRLAKIDSWPEIRVEYE
jgi:hypothetical protein